ncbi:MAG TPA: hypothetical protein VF796_02825 [Humisphaera sp.]
MTGSTNRAGWSPRLLASVLGFALTAGIVTAADAPSGGAIDWERAKALFVREQNGESLAPDEKAYLERAKAERQKPYAAARPAGGVDMSKARALNDKLQRGEALTADEQAYLERAKAGRPNGNAASPPGGVDMTKARALHDRLQRGETLTADEQAYLQRAKESMQRGQPSGPQGAGKPGSGPMAGKPAITGQESTGLVPLTQLKDGAKYKGQAGGLYGGGSNRPPEAHAKLAAAAASQVTPLDAAGRPAKDGKVVLMSIGMSNTTGEFSRFKQIADADPAKSPDLLIVDGAQGGKDAAAWANVGNGITNGTWEEADRRIKAAGATPQQVQVVWIKQALAGPSRVGDFPAHAQALQKDLETILAVAKARYPNLKLAYLSSRIYAGYAVTMLNPEPFAYEGAFAVRWVIDDQIKGEPRLNADPAKGDVKAPVALWGPYLWADGSKGREGDDLVWRPGDLGGDGTHPSPTGREKVAQLLLAFLKSNDTAKVWFVKR